jgi:hypothetical protein
MELVTRYGLELVIRYGFLLKLNLFYTLIQITVMALFFTHVPSPSTSFLHCTDLHSLLVYSFPLTSSTTILCHTTEVYLCLDSQQQQLVAPIPGTFIYPNYTGQISAVLGGSGPFNIMQAPHSRHPSLLRFPSPRLAWYTASQLLMVLRQAECPCNSTVCSLLKCF